MKPGGHDAENPMNGFNVRVAADLQDFVVVGFWLHLLNHAPTWPVCVSPRGTSAVHEVTVLFAKFLDASWAGASKVLPDGTETAAKQPPG
jgi:hypothetical protein